MEKSINKPPKSLKNDIHWVRPARNGIKINCDATVGVSKSVVGGIARDWRGSFVFVFAFKVNTNLPVQAKAKALRQATSIAISYNLQSVCFESDCKVCIDGFLVPNSPVPWRIANLLKEIEALVQTIPTASFSWVPRRENMVAHVLARWSLENRFFGFFDASAVPPFVLSVVLEDSTVVS
jgi:hypothetical protein